MSKWKKVKIGDFLKRIKRFVILEDEKEYKLVTIQLHHKGVKLRGYKKGREIKSKMHGVKAGDFILSGIDARNGAFGIVGDELDGAIVTNDFWYFELNEKLIDKHFFLELTSTKWFDEICRLGSDGTTQRIRLQKTKFFNQEIYLPSVDKQKEVSKKFISIKQKKELLEKECSSQQSHLTLLRQQILQDAISGKLTADWRAKNPEKITGECSAEHLLAAIKAEKKKLIAEKKIKKEKALPPISEDEEPFELPEGWEWCRLGEICSVQTGKKDANQGSENGKYNFYTCAKEPIKSDDYSFEGESILLPGNGANVGFVNFVNEKFEAYQRTYVLNNFLLILPEYIAKVLEGIWEKSLGNQYGSAINYIKLGNITDFKFPLPPLAEQRAIVAKVESLFAYLSQLEEKIQHNAMSAEHLMQAFLSEVFRK